MSIRKLFTATLLLLSGAGIASASEYDAARKAPQVNVPQWESFSLHEVTLTNSYFKQAMELHKKYLLTLEVDRLIPHVRRTVGLEPKGQNYGGWEKGGGCTYGHYMSGCALMYASTGDKTFLDRLDYIISELKACQSKTNDGWFITGSRGKEGYLKLMGGEVFLNQPDETKQPWNYNQNGNSWYCIHKVMGGLRDAYIYAGRKEALDVLVPLADFIANIALTSNKDLFQSTLSVEHGGMNEVFADLYGMTGDKKYLETAQRFNHINVIYPMANGEDVLFGRHANDQIPKFVGVAREYEYTANPVFLKAAENFWDIVTSDHTVAIGGNSCFERFGVPGEESKRLDYTSAETCNTYNMLKLTGELFRLKGDFNYLNYYEHALYNHILASLDPHEGGCMTYYTSLLPGFCKQYSTPYDSFWCCVGTGLENHSKYGESIYFKGENKLLVNLYIASKLNWEEKQLQLTMDTSFPESDTIRVKIDKIGQFNGALMFRYPSWAGGNATVFLNGKTAAAEYKEGEYIRLLASVASGDEVTLVFPRHLYIRYTKDEPNFGSVMYGPLLLAGGLGTAHMPEDHVVDNRAMREVLPVKDIPMLVGSKVDMDSWIVRTSDHPLRFEVKNGGGQKGIELIPYFQMHHQWHSVYWKIYSPEEFQYRKRVLTDEVIIGDEANEKRHALKGERDSLYWHDYFWAKNTQYRMAQEEGWFSYDLAVDKKEVKPYHLICRYWGDEKAENCFEIWIDGQLLRTVDLNRKLYLTYVDEVYDIPAGWTKGKSKITVAFRSGKGQKAGGLYQLKVTADPDFR